MNMTGTNIEAALKRDLESMKDERMEKTSSALSLLMEVTASETIEIIFEAKGKKAKIEIIANPPQKILTELFQAAQKAEQLAISGDAQGDVIKQTEERLCEILEYLTVQPKISKAVWQSGELSDEIASRIIFELMKYKVQKREVMEQELIPFRQNRRGAKNFGDRRVTQAPAISPDIPE